MSNVCFVTAAADPNLRHSVGSVYAVAARSRASPRTAATGSVAYRTMVVPAGTSGNRRRNSTVFAPLAIRFAYTGRIESSTPAASKPGSSSVDIEEDLVRNPRRSCDRITASGSLLKNCLKLRPCDWSRQALRIGEAIREQRLLGIAVGLSHQIIPAVDPQTREPSKELPGGRADGAQGDGHSSNRALGIADV